MRKTLAGVAGVVALTVPSALTAEAHAAEPTETWVMNSATVHGADQPVRITAVGPVQGTGLVTQTEEETRTGEVVHATWHFRAGTVTADAFEDYALDFDPASCTAKATSSGTWAFTGGTGAYAGASGQGTFTGHASLVGSRDERGHCQGPDSGGEPKVAISTLSGTGTADLP